LIQDWTLPSGAIQSPRTASAVFQTLETRWAVDSVAARREITALLADQPALAHALANGVARCPPEGCSCPTPPKIAQTAQTAYSVPLEVSYRVDATGTSVAVALFLSRHYRLLIYLSDSLSRSPGRRK
jgi:hypothetical protein